jgi:hypothetical protein
MSTVAHAVLIVVSVPPIVMLAWLIRRGRLRAKYAMIWIPVLAAVATLAAVPGLSDSVARTLGVSYPPALFFLLAIVLLVMVSLHYAWELSRLEERVRVLAEEIALSSSRLPIDDHDVRQSASTR